MAKLIKKGTPPPPKKVVKKEMEVTLQQEVANKVAQRATRQQEGRSAWKELFRG